MVVMIDNYDSFTYNLVQYFKQLGAELQVYRNDQITIESLAALSPSHLVISPGPRTPLEAGISLSAIRFFAGKIPILGVCLGHQSIGYAFGGKFIHARKMMHGKTSPIHHAQQGVFQNLPSPFEATRYHSLIVDSETLPDCFEVTAWTAHEEGTRDEIMGIRHRDYAIEGVQFHPEAILTQHGHLLLKNFITTG